MRRPAVLGWLVPLVLVLGFAQSAAGLFWQPAGVPGAFRFPTLHGQVADITGTGAYAWDTVFFSAGFRGMDVVTLLVGLPVLALAFHGWQRGSLHAALVLAGTLAYFVYVSASLTFSAAFNPLFLLYVALLGCSLYGLLFALTAIDPAAVVAHVRGRLPRRSLASFLVVAGLGTLGLWLSDLLPPLVQGTVPALGPYTTMFTHGFDSAVITPAAVITGVYVWQRRAVGYLLATPVVILCVFNGAVVIASTISQTLAGLTFSPGVYVGLIGSWVVLAAWAAWAGARFFRALGAETVPEPETAGRGRIG